VASARVPLALRLRTCHEQNNFVVRISFAWLGKLASRPEYPVTKAISNLDIFLHRAPENADLTIELLGHIEHDLQSVNRRGKGGDDNPAARFAKFLRTPESPRVLKVCGPDRG